MLNTNQGGLDPSSARPFGPQFTAGQPQGGNAFPIGGRPRSPCACRAEAAKLAHKSCPRQTDIHKLAQHSRLQPFQMAHSSCGVCLLGRLSDLLGMRAAPRRVHCPVAACHQTPSRLRVLTSGNMAGFGGQGNFNLQGAMPGVGGRYGSRHCGARASLAVCLSICLLVSLPACRQCRVAAAGIPPDADRPVAVFATVRTCLSVRLSIAEPGHPVRPPQMQQSSAVSCAPTPRSAGLTSRSVCLPATGLDSAACPHRRRSSRGRCRAPGLAPTWEAGCRCAKTIGHSCPIWYAE
jgi:hypothetical protein